MAKKYGMIHDENLCIGCQACNVACRSENDIPESVYRLQVWVNGPKEMRDGSMAFEYHRQSCVHCDDTQTSTAHRQTPSIDHFHAVAHVIERGVQTRTRRELRGVGILRIRVAVGGAGHRGSLYRKLERVLL